MTELSEKARASVNSLLKLDEQALYEELGLRLNVMEMSPEISGSFDPDFVRVESLGIRDDVRAFTKAFFKRVNRQTYELICDADSESVKERNKVLEAFRIGPEYVAAALAAFLVTNMAIAPAAAPVIAALIVKVVLGSAQGALCDVWGAKIDQTN
jgi:hypothetical protein